MSIKDKEKREKELWLKAFGVHLRRTRLKKGISGAELGRLLLVDPPNISRLEKGLVNPSIYLIKQVCEVLELTLDEFFEDFKN